MKMMFLAVAIFAVFQAPAQAERWAAIGIVETQVVGHPTEARVHEFDSFESEDLCLDFVRPNSFSDDYIGKGGTNNRMGRVDWNFDAICVKKAH